MNIKEKRNALNLTQDKLSKMTGIQVRVIQKIEKENYCTLKNAIKISKALKSTIEELFKELYEDE